MKKLTALMLSLLFLLVAVAGCATDPVTTDTDTAVTADDTEDTAEVTEEPAYTYPSELDNYAGKPAYTVEGDTIIVNGVSYPNTKNMTNGALYAVDDLGREVGLDGKAYVSDGSKNVGVFYFLWHGEHGDNGILDMTKIMNEGGTAARKSSYKGWGPVGAMHFWGEPLYGYYYASDKWVQRRHVDELMLANVDFVYIDATNGYPYISSAKSLMNIIHEYKEQGFDAPEVVFYTHSSCAQTVAQIYQQIYSKDYCPDAWFYMDGKPVIIAYEDEVKKGYSQAKDFFTFREPQWPTESAKRNGWPWMDFSYPARVFKNKDGQKEAISVSVAQHCGTVCFSDSAFYGDRSNHGRSWHDKKYEEGEDATLYGYNFQDQWDRALKVDVPYVLVTGWNEWVAQRQDGSQHGRSGQVMFVDTASMEFSRDIEPMRGGYFDNYYMQLTDNIRKYKGVAPTFVQDTRKVIDINGSFDQWNDILVEYTDPTGDCENRRNLGFGNSRLTDNSGNNDLRSAKITHDTKYMYFYIDVPETYDDEDNFITAYAEDTTWMQLFLNVDMRAETGFYGFDYIVNYSIDQNGKMTVARAAKNGKEFDFEVSAEADYRVEKNKMMIRVALADIGIPDYSQISIAFKWADSDTKITTMEQMYTEGDCAPHGRFSYVFKNY